MATTLAAARASLPGGPFSKTFHPGCTSHHSYSSLQSEREIQPEVFLRKALETDKNEGAVCFESLAGLHAKSRFFRDNTDAAYWRQWVSKASLILVSYTYYLLIDVPLPHRV